MYNDWTYDSFSVTLSSIVVLLCAKKTISLFFKVNRTHRHEMMKLLTSSNAYLLLVHTAGQKGAKINREPEKQKQNRPFFLILWACNCISDWLCADLDNIWLAALHDGEISRVNVNVHRKNRERIWQDFSSLITQVEVLCSHGFCLFKVMLSWGVRVI